jgi:hypothetical protein
MTKNKTEKLNSVGYISLERKSGLTVYCYSILHEGPKDGLHDEQFKSLRVGWMFFSWLAHTV